MEEKDYLTLIGNIDDISHLLPFYDMWDVSRLIRNDKKSYTFWTKHTTDEILSELKKSDSTYFFEEVI